MMIMILIIIKKEKWEKNLYLSKNSFAPNSVLYALRILSHLNIIILILQMKKSELVSI